MSDPLEQGEVQLDVVTGDQVAYAVRQDEPQQTYIREDVVRAQIEELEAKLAKAVWRLEQMRDDRTGYRHPSHFIRGAAVTLAEVKGDKT